MVHAKDANFIACLALHQARRDKTLGLTHVTAKQKGLVWYYNTLQAEMIREYAKMGITFGNLKEIERRIKRIYTEARKKTTPLERKRELLIEAIKLEELAKQWQAI